MKLFTIKKPEEETDANIIESKKPKKTKKMKMKLTLKTEESSGESKKSTQ